MTVQNLCDELTTLAHTGLAQAEVCFMDGYEVKNVEKVIIIDEQNIQLRGQEDEQSRTSY
jgi:hypothetical protein